MNEVEVERSGSVTWIAINRPEKSNALSAAMFGRIAEAVRALDGAPGEEVLVIEARGERGFSAGADIAEVAEGRPGLERQERAVFALADALAACPAIRITVLHGYAKGGAALFPCLSDVVLARDDLALGLPEIRFGMYPVLLHAVLTERIPRALAWQLCATGRTLGAAEAVALGLVSEIVASGGFRSAVDKRIADYAAVRAALALGRGFAERSAALPLRDRMALAGEAMHCNFALPGVSTAIEHYGAGLSSAGRAKAETRR